MTADFTLLRRRALLVAAAGAGLVPALALGQAQYPSRTVTLVMPLAAGGAADALGRLWADFASKQLGSPVVVENRPGANGSLAASYVAKQPADGYTLLMSTASNMALNQFAYKSLGYKPSDFDGIALLATTSQVLVANPGTGFKTIDDVIKAAKAKPGEIAYGSAGKGNSTHINVEVVARHHGLKLNHIPYKGAAPAMVGVIGGETQLVTDAATSAVPQSKAGKVVPLLVFGPSRIPALPGVPTADELGIKNTYGGGWYGLSAPAGTPKAILDKLNAVTQAMWADPASKAKLAAIYMEQLPDKGTGAVAAYTEQYAKRWGPILQELGVQAQ